MGFYDDHILPRVIDVCCNMKATREVRARVLAPAHGDVLEIGSGSGINAAYYPDTVTGVWVVEPSAKAKAMAAKKQAKVTIPFTYAGPDAQVLDLPDDRFDEVISTYTLCTVPDADAAISELFRVLKPGGTFRFVEHGRAPDAKVAARQDRWDRRHGKVFGGCHVNREFPALIEKGGFTVVDYDAAYEKGAPKYAGWITEGIATKT
jgi:ubiquinone/menaquinone biosynthesis C-methylase UbiE